MSSAIPLLGQITALADPVRSRVLLVLEGHELTVNELCAVLQLPQSTMSRHLKTLGDEGWAVSRAEGTSRRYSMAPVRLEPRARKLWAVIKEEVAGSAAAAQDAQRLRGVLAERRSRSREFFSTAAGSWDRLRAELFGQRADLVALLGLLDENWIVGDLGCGTGKLTETLAPFVRQVIAVDESGAMLAAARRRLAAATNVDLRTGEVESLPIEDDELDAAILFLVLPYLAEPARALAEAARVLRPGGRLLVVDMTSHDREDYRQQMGHLWQGFSAEQMRDWLGGAGLDRVRYVALPADPAAKGPTLFAASARKRNGNDKGQGRGPDNRLGSGSRVRARVSDTNPGPDPGSLT